MEIKEKSESNNYDLVPRQKGVFKLRSNVDKKVVVSVQQISQNSCNLAVERCFGMLVSPGRNVRHADMQLLEHVTMATTSSPNADVDFVTHVITGNDLRFKKKNSSNQSMKCSRKLYFSDLTNFFSNNQ